MRLLLAEDEKSLSKVLTAILERNNYQKAFKPDAIPEKDSVFLFPRCLKVIFKLI